MITKTIWENALYELFGFTYLDIFLAVIMTPFTLVADILTFPFQIIAYIIYKEV